MIDQCKTIADYPTASGVMPMLYSIRDCIPYAFEGMLLIIFLMVFGANYFISKARVGRPKILMGLVATSLAFTVLSLIVALMQLVTFTTVLFYAFLTIVSFILLNISDRT